MGLVACLGAGLIEVLAAPFAERLRRATPRAALLSTLGGIALGFISFSFLFRTYASPVVGFTTLGVILLVYFGKVRFRGGLPGGFVAVMLQSEQNWIQCASVKLGTLPDLRARKLIARIFHQGS